MTLVTQSYLDHQLEKVQGSVRSGTRRLEDRHTEHDKDFAALAKVQAEVNTRTVAIKTYMHEQIGDIQRYAMTDLIGQAIGGSGEAIGRMIAAFGNNRHREGAAEILRFVGSASKMAFIVKDVFGIVNKATKWAGPIGAIVSEFLGIFAAVLEGFGEEQKPIGEELKEQLAEALGGEYLDTLEGLLDAYELSRAKLLERPGSSMTWDEIDRVGNLTSSLETVFLGKAESFLRRLRYTENWEEVFESYLYARSQSLQNVMLAVGAVRKYDAAGNPTFDLVEMINVLTALARQCDEFIETFGRIAIDKGVRWFIGENQNIYRIEGSKDARIGFRDTQALALAVGNRIGKQDRIWHIGTNHAVYSGLDGDWKEVEGIKVDGLWVAPSTDQNSHVVTLRAKRVAYHEWIEETGKLSSDTKFAPFDVTKPPRRDGKDVDVMTLALKDDGLIVIDEGCAMWLWDDTGAREIAGPTDAKPTRIASDGTFVYVTQGAHLWRKRLDELELEDVAWAALGDPAETFNSLKPGWQYDDLFAPGDGSLLAIIEKHMYAYFDGEWQRCGWTEGEEHVRVVDGNTAKRVVKRPIKPAEMFSALQALVADFHTVVNRIDATRPLVAQLAPMLVEVKVYDDRFEPASARVRAGGTIRWTWEHTGRPIAVSAQDPSFESPALSTGSFDQSFNRPGSVAYQSKDGRSRGTVVVEK